MNSKRIHSPYTYLILLLILALVGYNLWSYSCGYCTMASLTSLSPPAILLIACNLMAGGVLLFLRVRNRRLVNGNFCCCGELLHHNWEFCPHCGRARSMA